MSGFFESAQEWLMALPHLGRKADRRRRRSLLKQADRRQRSRTLLTMESVEPRVLLSTAADTLLKASAISQPVSENQANVSTMAIDQLSRVHIAAIAAPKVATQISAVSASGVQGGTAKLSAVLTSDGAALSGRIVRFQVGGKAVGRAITDANGLAVLSGVKLRAIKTGVYPRGITAVFTGDAAHKGNITRGGLTVSQFPTGLTGVAAAGVFGNTGVLTASLSSRGAALSGQSIAFTLDGKSVGSATTNAQGIATLSGVTLPSVGAGSYSNAVIANFTGSPAYQAMTQVGNLTVTKAQTAITLSGLNQTYDGKVKSVTVATSPTTPPVSVVYTDASGKVVTNPISAGSYGVTATVSDANYSGTETGTLVIAQAQLTATGITASGKVYDGSTSANINTTSTVLSGVIPGDVVTLTRNNAIGTFASAGVGAGKTVTISGLTLSGASASNYALTLPTTTANISAATLQVSGVTAQNKAYDGTTTATLNTTGATLSGVIAGDVVTLESSHATATFASSGVGTGKAVSVTGLGLSGASAPNYVLAQPTASANITAATLTVSGITVANKVYDGTTNATIDTSGATLVGVVGGENVTLDLNNVTGAFQTASAGTSKAVAISGLTIGGLAVDNYVLAEPTVTANIATAALAVSGITASSKTYDGTTVTTIDTTGAVLHGALVGDDVTLVTTTATGNFSTKDAGTGKTVVIGGLTLAGAASANYSIDQTTTTADVTTVTVTVTGVTALTKGYDGTTAATLNFAGAALVGVVAGDTVSLDTTNATGTFDSPTIGTGKLVTISGLALAGTDAANYVVVQPTTTADITVGTLTISGITASNKIYDGTTSANVDLSGATLVGVAAGEDVALDTTNVSFAFDTKDAGANKTITISGLTLIGPDASKYILAPITLTANIEAITLTVSGITATGKVYDGSTNATIDTTNAVLSTGVLSGEAVTLDVTGAVGNFDSKNAGTNKTVTVTGLLLTGADAANYVITPPTTSADVTVATVTVLGVTADNKGYDGTTTATLEFANATLDGEVLGDDVALDPTNAVGTFDSPAIGTDKLVTITGLALSGSDAANYVLVQPTTTANITVGTLTVDGIIAQNKAYDGTTAATVDLSGATLVGVATGEDVQLDTSNATYAFDTKAAGTAKSITISGLTLTGADASKYVLGPITVTADIAAVTLTVSGITAGGKVYDGSTATSVDTSAATLSAGILAGDDASLDVTGATGSFDTKNVGVGKTVTVGGLTLAGADAANYVITPPTTTADVTAASLTVAGVTAENKAYDGTTTATLDFTNATLVGAVATDNVSLHTSTATGTFDSPDIGTGKLVTITGVSLTGADAGNYVLVQPTATANITVESVTVSGIVASNKTYDRTTTATVDLADAVLMGVAAGDDVSLDTTNATASFATRNAGVDNTITITGLVLVGADASKYTLGPVTVSANIDAATLDVTGISPSNKVYDGTTATTVDTNGATLVGGISGDDVTLDATNATADFDTKNAGLSKLVNISGLLLTGADAANYVLAPTTATAEIAAATLTVTGLSASSKVYDGTTSASIDTSAASLSGVVAGDAVTLDTSNATGMFDSKNAGTDKSVSILGLVLNGADASNYVLAPPTATADVTAATLTVSGITAADKSFDGTTAATLDTSAAALNGVISGDNVALETSAAIGTFDTPDVGTDKTVFITGLALTGTDAANYVLIDPTTTASITS